MPHQTNGKFTTFGQMLRAVRVGAKLKQKDLAALIEVGVNTIGNAESSEFRVFGRRRVEAIADALRLTPDVRARLLELHAAAPLTEFAQRQRERWEAIHQRRREESANRSATADLAVARDQLALARQQLDVALAARDAHAPIREALILFLDLAALAGDACGCDAAIGSECPLCRGMRALGAPDGWVDSATATRHLGEIRDADDPALDFGGELDFGG